MSGQIEPRVGCGVAIVADGRILLIRRLREPEPDHWGIPGGKIDLFETATDAARREIAEEVGLAVEPADLLCFVDQIDSERGTHWVAPIYLVDRFEGTPEIIEPDKHDALGWFALDALPAPLTTPTHAAVAALRARGF